MLSHILLSGGSVLRMLAMGPRLGGSRALFGKSLIAALGVWIALGSSALADGNPCAGCGSPLHRDLTLGTLGYGPPGLFPGVPGFGLGYHLGYGYGGRGLGTGAEGGYPCYGGPGYPHCEPVLRRCGGITPFCYYAGPGNPTPEQPNYYGAVGPLVGDQPVITVGSDVDYPSHYGQFTGTLPYSEEFLSPFTFRAAAAGSASGVSTETPASTPVSAPAPPASSAPPVPAPGPGGGSPGAQLESPGRRLGIDAEPIVEGGGVHGMRVTRVYPGTAAATAGVEPGDVIHSINGRLTEKTGHLTWILAHTAPGNVLDMHVRRMSDGTQHTVTARAPAPAGR